MREYRYRYQRNFFSAVLQSIIMILESIALAMLTKITLQQIAKNNSNSLLQIVLYTLYSVRNSHMVTALRFLNRLQTSVLILCAVSNQKYTSYLSKRLTPYNTALMKYISI